MTPSPKPLRAPLPLPRSPGTFPPCVRRLGLASGPPSTGHVARSLPPYAHRGSLLRWQRLLPSALPQPHASSPCSPRRGGPPVAPCPLSLGGSLRKPLLLPPTWPQAPTPLSHPWHWLSRPHTRLCVSTPVPTDTLRKDGGPRPHPPKSHLRLTPGRAPHPSALPPSTPGPRALFTALSGQRHKI